MRYVDLQAAFEIEINKIDQNLEKPKSVDTEYWLNQGLEKFCKTRYSGTNYKSKGFEQDQKRIDYLRTLVRTKIFQLDEESWNLIQEGGGKYKTDQGSYSNVESVPMDKIQADSETTFYIRLPKNYMFLLGDSVSIIPVKGKSVECAKKDNDGNIIPIVGDTLEASIETINR